MRAAIFDGMRARIPVTMALMAVTVVWACLVAGAAADGDTGAQPAIAEEPRDPLAQPIYFGYDSAALTDQALEQLDRVVRWLFDHPDKAIVIRGHASEVGPRLYNQRLAHYRALRVRQYLLARGVAADRLRVVSAGESRPIAENPARNRRVTLSVVPSGNAPGRTSPGPNTPRDASER